MHAFYELNKIGEIARSRLPNNEWLEKQLTTHVNLMRNTSEIFVWLMGESKLIFQCIYHTRLYENVHLP